MWVCVYVEVCVHRCREFDVSSTVALVCMYIFYLNFYFFVLFEPSVLVRMSVLLWSSVNRCVYLQCFLVYV